MIIDISAGTVRVLKGAGKTAGAGFLVTPDGLVVTCAHVVHSPRSKAGEPRPKSVTVEFANGDRHEAAVVEEFWRPWDAEDIAVLRVAKPLPPGAVHLPLGASPGTSGHRFETYGFPRLEAARALRGYGTVGGRVPRQGQPDYLQLVDSGIITEGFSGAPVWDIHTSRAIGMVDSFPNEDEFGRLSGVTFVTPTESIRAACPELVLSETCPYRPLQAFTEGDQALFFGRGDVLQTLIPRVTRERFVALLGPSGCGKSSLIRAGLVPQLRSGTSPSCEVMVTRLRLDPANDLDRQGLTGAAKDLLAAVLDWCQRARSSSDPARRLVLVFDQFEQVLSPGWEPAGPMLAAIRSILETDLIPVTVVLVMWDAFYSRLLEVAPFLAERLGPAVLNIPPTLSGREVEDMIRKPAQAAGLSVEEELVGLILKDSAEVDLRGGEGQIHNTVLPLLQLALADLWNRRRDGVLTVAGYRGIRDALVDWINTSCQEFQEHDKQHPDAPLMPYVRRTFIDLVEPGNVAEGVPDARPPRPINSLYRGDGDERERKALDRVIARLVTARLLVVFRDSAGQEWVEIIHDAVITKWGDLQEWLRKARRLLDWRRSNGGRVKAWTERGRAHSDDALLRSRELAEFEGLISDDSPLLTGEERAFLETSKTAIERAQQQQEASRKRELDQAQALAETAKAREEEARGRERVTAALAVSVVVLLLVGGAGLWVWQIRQAEKSRAAADAAQQAERRDQNIEARVAETALLRNQGRLGEARKTLEAAEKGVADGAPAALAERVRRARKDLDMVTGLAEAPLAGRLVGFDPDAVAVSYRKLFQQYGVNMEALEPAEAATRIRASDIREQLIVGLDDWESRLAVNAALKARLLDAVERADDDLLRRALRQPQAGLHWQDLEKLLDHYEVSSLRPSTVMRIRSVTGSLQFLRKAQQAHPHDFWINYSLSETLFIDAEAVSFRAFLDEAIGFMRVAVALKPDSPNAHNFLGVALYRQGRPKEAEAEYRWAIKLKDDDPVYRVNLGEVLTQQGRWAEAEKELRQAIQLKEDLAEAHHNLGTWLTFLSKRGEAEKEFCRAIELKKGGYPEAQFSLGRVQMAKGNFDEATRSFQQALEWLPCSDPRCDQVKKAMARCKTLVELDKTLPRVLKSDKEVDADQRIDYAILCQCKQRYASAARLYEKAFEEKPALANDFKTNYSYWAVAAAALAGLGQGDDASNLDDKERARLRNQALAWLQAARTALDKPKGDPRFNPQIQFELRRWQADADLAGVREADALAKLPESEREAWQKLWADVDEFVKELVELAHTPLVTP